jgi:hypothetical protein
MVKWNRQGTTPDSSITAIWQSYKKSSSNKVGGTGRTEWWIWPYEVHLFILGRDISYAVKSYTASTALHTYVLSFYPKATDVDQVHSFVFNQLCSAVTASWAMPCLRQLVAGLSPRRPGLAPGRSTWDFRQSDIWTGFSPSSSVSSCQ